tara:strand:- start:476 stop:745 length:270 start_codon:yes stop_codon:yes gene_type:complete
LRKITIIFIKAYQIFISPWLPPSCRHLPTCSEYAIESLNKHGFFWGIMIFLKRLLSCNPWGSYGFDPVPKSVNSIYSKKILTFLWLKKS